MIYKNEKNTRKILEATDRYFFAFGRFPATNKLTVAPTGNVPSFVHWRDVFWPSELPKRYNLIDTRGLVCVHFLAALNVHLGGDKMISKIQ